MSRTTINIDNEIRKALKQIKEYKRETYDDTLKRLIKDAMKRKPK